jgi:hypothetical protein
MFSDSENECYISDSQMVDMMNVFDAQFQYNTNISDALLVKTIDDMDRNVASEGKSNDVVHSCIYFLQQRKYLEDRLIAHELL